MRKFYFLNSSGERWPLQGEKGVYLTDPTGLGVTLAQTYADLQNGFFVGVSSANEPQSAPHATLLFSTDYLDSYVRKLSASGVATDLLSKIDLDGEPFFRLPLTEPCTLTIAAQAAISGAADVEVFYYYRSV